MLAAMRRTSSRVSSFDRDQCRKTAWRLLMAHARAHGDRTDCVGLGDVQHGPTRQRLQGKSR
jgi:hypothetical protein